MHSDFTDVPDHSSHDTKGLPVVVPLSGKFLGQLFLVPGLIVSGAVLILLGFSWMAGGPRSPDEFLKGLRNPNPDVRWRAASDLAQVLPRDERLAGNASFGLDLAQLLQQGIEENERNEALFRPAKPGASTSVDHSSEEKKTRDAQRELIFFLTSSLGHFQAPVGGPILAEIATNASKSDEALLRRRQNAIWALGKLGEKLQHFSGLSPEQQRTVETNLAGEVEKGGERGRWAAEAQQALAVRAMPAVDRALEACSRDPDPLIRKFVALAGIYWEGPGIEEILLRLASEQGRGGEPASEDVRRLEVRYQATVALARKGSPYINELLPVLQEMLDEAKQRDNLRIEIDGRSQPDYGAIESTITNALNAVVELHKKRPDLDLSTLDPLLRQLVHSPQFAVAAKRAWLALGRSD